MYIKGGDVGFGSPDITKMTKEKKDFIETTIYVLLLSSSAFMFLLTEHTYSTKILLGLLLVTPALVEVKKKKIERPGKYISALWMGMAVIALFYLITGIMYRVKAYILISFVIAIIVPVLQYYFIQREDRIVYRMCAASALFYAVLVFLSFLAGPSLSAIQFGGILINQNALGLACVTVFPAGLALCRENKVKIGAILIAADTAFIIFSTSRTAVIAVVLQLIYALIIGISDVVHGHIKKEKLYKSIAAILCFSIVGFFLFFWTFTTLKEAEARMLPSIQIEIDEGMSLEELYLKFGARMGKGLDGEGDYAFSSGRVGIWKDYIENLTFFGHEKEERDQVVSGSRLYFTTNAHNAYLQVAYGAGIPAGVGLLFVAVLAAFGCFRKSIPGIKGKRINDKDYYAVLTVLGFGIVSITSSNWMMFVHIPAMIFWTVTAYLLADQDTPVDEKEN